MAEGGIGDDARAAGGRDVPPGAVSGESAEDLGAALAALRKRRRLTGEQLGRRLDMSQAKISKIERGVIRIKPHDAELIATELGAPADSINVFVNWAERLHSMPIIAPPEDVDATVGVEMRREIDLRLPDQEEIADREAAATLVRNFEVLIVPGLLQISEYARRIVNGYFTFAFGDSEPLWGEAARLGSRRGGRQVVLYGTDKTFEFFIMESALSSPLLTPGQILAQVDRIEEASKLPNVTVKVVPNNARLRYPPVSGFNLIDDRAVILEIGGTPFTLRDQKEIDFHRRIFEHYASLAVQDLGGLLEVYKARYAEEAYPKDGSGLAAGPTGK